MLFDLFLDFFLGELVLFSLVFFRVNLVFGFLELHGGLCILSKLLFVFLILVGLSQRLLSCWSLLDALLDSDLAVLALLLDKALEADWLLLPLWSTPMRWPCGKEGVDVDYVLQESPLSVCCLDV